MNKIKVFIVMFNLLTWPRKMAEFLSDTGCEVILLDNNSSYRPLLEWYSICPYKVHRFSRNFGELIFWDAKLIEKYQDRYYVVTDPDLELEGIPRDYMEVLFKSLDNHPDLVKSGFSLEIEDLPENKFTRKVREWENHFWTDSQDSLGFFYPSAVDTTFALYDRERYIPICNEIRLPQFYSGSRSPRPYTAKHLPWYSIPETLTEEERCRLVTGKYGFWHKQFRKCFKGRYKLQFRK